MNDWYNDPPEEPETPECCGEEMNVKEDGTAFCACCFRTITPEPEPEELEGEGMGDLPPPEPPAKCPHGNEWNDCNACYVASDLAYDASRGK